MEIRVPAPVERIIGQLKDVYKRQVVTAVLVIFIRNNMMSKGKLTVDSND